MSTFTIPGKLTALPHKVYAEDMSRPLPHLPIDQEIQIGTNTCLPFTTHVSICTLFSVAHEDTRKDQCILKQARALGEGSDDHLTGKWLSGLVKPFQLRSREERTHFLTAHFVVVVNPIHFNLRQH